MHSFSLSNEIERSRKGISLSISGGCLDFNLDSSVFKYPFHSKEIEVRINGIVLGVLTNQIDANLKVISVKTYRLRGIAFSPNFRDRGSFEVLGFEKLNAYIYLVIDSKNGFLLLVSTKKLDLCAD